MVEYVVIEYQAPCLLLSRRKYSLAEMSLDSGTVGMSIAEICTVESVYGGIVNDQNESRKSHRSIDRESLQE
jgi:hypothetical protein